MSGQELTIEAIKELVEFKAKKIAYQKARTLATKQVLDKYRPEFESVFSKEYKKLLKDALSRLPK